MEAETDTTPDDSRLYPHQGTSTVARVLSVEEKDKLEQDSALVSEFKQNKLEREAQKNWDLFYKRNTTKFFKDRHWTTREFTDLCRGKAGTSQRLVALEVGCGVGNFIFPLLAEVDHLFFYACDFSPRAVQFVKDSPSYDADRCCVFQNDLTKDDLTQHVAPHSVDVVTMIFVLSAIHPSHMLDALRNVHTVLKPGGRVLIRDYGLYDHAMLRFAPGHKLSENFYVRQDGTRAYYFSKEKLSALFEEAGFMTESSEYILRETVNKRQGLCVPRVFVQAKFTTSEHPRTDICTMNSSKQPQVQNDGYMQCPHQNGCDTNEQPSSSVISTDTICDSELKLQARDTTSTTSDSLSKYEYSNSPGGATSCDTSHSPGVSGVDTSHSAGGSSVAVRAAEKQLDRLCVSDGS